MNKTRRANLRKVFDLISEARALLEEIVQEEREALDNTPESLQTSERYEQATEDCDTLDERMTDLEDIEEELEDIINR
jgi:hypothetical protein